MTKVNKMFKAITVFVAIAMIAALLPVSVFAENVVTIDAPDQVSTTDTIVVKGNIAAGNELTILAVRHTAAITGPAEEALGLLEGLADSKIMYIDQVTSNGSDYEFSFKLRNDANASQDGSYLIVFMGGTEASAVYDCIELVSGGPEDLDMTAESYTGNVEFTFTDDAAWRENLTVEVKSGEDTVDVTPVVAEGSIKLNLPAGTYTVTFTAAGYYSTTKTITVADRAAGTATLNAPADGKAYYFDNEAITLTLEGGYADWADLAKAGISVVGDALAAYDAETGAITVDGVGNFTVKFAEIAGYGATADITFEVKSYGQAIADAAIAAVTSAANAADTEGTTWLVTVPAAPLADFTGDYAFAWAIEPDVALAETVYTITRPATDAAEATYTLTLTVTYAGNEYTATKEVKVAPQGVNGPTFGDVTFLKASGAYGTSGNALVKVVVEDGLDNSGASMKYGEAKFYYSPVKNAYYAIVPTGVSADDLVAGIEVVEETASEVITFGVAYPGNTAMNSYDVFYAMRIFQRKTTDADRAALSDKVYISYDVSTIEPDGTLNSNDVFEMMRVFQRKQPALTVHTSAE